MFTPVGAYLPVPKRLALFRQGLATLRGHHLLWRIVLLQTTLIALTATGLFLAARALPGGQTVSWPVALMLGLISMVANVVNVLGVEQAAAMACAALLRIDPNLGLMASAMFRLTAIAVVFTAGPFMAHWLSRRAPVTEDPAAARAARRPDGYPTTATTPATHG
jgi:hypothetical protein